MTKTWFFYDLKAGERESPETVENKIPRPSFGALEMIHEEGIDKIVVATILKVDTERLNNGPTRKKA